MSLIFLQTHIEFMMDNTGFNDQKPVIVIFGVTKKGDHIQLYVHDFYPYFYVKPSLECSEEDIQNAINKLDKKLLKVEKVMSRSIYGYQGEASEFYKLTFSNPSVFYSLKSILEEGLIINNRMVSFKLFESNFPFVLRFMVDLDIRGMCYLKIKQYNSESDVVFHTNFDQIEPMPLSGDFMILPDFKTMSIDIECVSNSGGFPSAKLDPVIQIGCTTNYRNSTTQAIFCLRETAEIPGASVYSFESEEDLLLAWKEYFMEVDPDILIGYNIKAFDLPYILDRAEVLKLSGFSVLGRTHKACKSKDTMFSSRQFGSIAGSEIVLEGRLIFDLMQIIRRDFKLRSYSLNSVSLHFLQEQKEDVPHSSMHELFETSPETRRRIASYCLKDTILPLRLFTKLNILINYTELARVTGVPIDYFSSRGTSIKVLTLIYREAKKQGYLIPVLDPSNSTTFEGGFVMDPLRGFYSKPIAVLDFSSLYPSIMISKNLCYTTLLTKDQYNKLGGIKTPTNNFFALPDLKKGVLPTILTDLIASRKATKKEMKEAPEHLKSCLNARQLAIKVCANSIYGFTGATIGKLPCLEISQSTTAFGREMIAFSKKIIEETFCKSKGYSHDSKVIYGDTDSVMINFEESDMHKVFQMAAEISQYVTTKFIKPVALEFEKVYSPYLLINKKRYAGLIYTNPDTPSKIDTKGIETVRRDNCGLVKNVIETSLNKILFEKDVEGAKLYVKNIIRDLYCGKIDLSLLVISKGITKSGEKYASKQAHIELAEKMKQRGDESAGAVGNRVAYIMVKKDKKTAGYEKAEDPVYVLENNLPIDTEYYIEQQLAKPLHRLFEPIVDNVSELLKGEHTRVVSNPVQIKGPLNAFLKPTTVCVGCKASGKILCNNCKGDFYKHLVKLQGDVEEKKEAYSDCWTECQRCQGSLKDDILCENRDCTIFYRRTRVKKELSSVSKKLNQLRDLEW
ncbi:DNA polymerase delta catalytic subunit [Nosema granulosis]|uniref:DNA polymerase n=1 Tax=Nosema granulosis TaxID=83296 RepID=A0A9P6KZM5_9MICR|nr:DNA polymerase delta catalytic subunit [Nosema granulosis]